MAKLMFYSLGFEAHGQDSFFNTSAETVLALLYAEELKDTACSQAFQDAWR